MIYDGDDERFVFFKAPKQSKVKLSLCTLWRQGKTRVTASPISISALDGGEWPISCPNHFIFAERTLCTHWTRGWVGLKASLAALEKRWCHAPAGSSLSSHYTDWQLFWLQK